MSESKYVLRGTVVEPAASTKPRGLEYFRSKPGSGVVHGNVTGAWATVLAGTTTGRSRRAGGLSWGGGA